MSEYIGIAVAFVLAGVITAAMVVLASTLGKKKPSPVKSEPFECGESPFSLPGGKLAIKFYLTAILFILFDDPDDVREPGARRGDGGEDRGRLDSLGSPDPDGDEDPRTQGELTAS
jgi:NADH-ubiquinone/plastoquinone oxidoreductase subunit 3